MRKEHRIATALLLTAMVSKGEAAQFPPNAADVVKLPVHEAFDAAVGTSLAQLDGWFIDGECLAEVGEGSLTPTQADVAAAFGSATGGHLVVRSTGSTADLGWSLGSAVPDNLTEFYYSFLVRARIIPYNGPLAGLRRHANGAGVAFALRGDVGRQQGGTNSDAGTGIILRPGTQDVAFPQGTPTLRTDGRTTHFVVVKCERTTGSLRMTVWLDPNPAADAQRSAPWITGEDASGDSSKIRWFSLGVHKERTDFAVDEVRVGGTWDSVMPGGASSNAIPEARRHQDNPETPVGSDADKIVWVPYNPLSLQEELNRRSSVLLYFRSSEAKNCKVFEQNYLMAPTMAEYLGGSTVHFVNMDVPGEVDLPPQLGVVRVPTLVRYHEAEGITHTLSFTEKTTPKEVLEFLQHLRSAK